MSGRWTHRRISSEGLCESYRDLAGHIRPESANVGGTGRQASAAISWAEGSAVAMDFPDASFDVIVCQQGLQFFPDRKANVREMLRVPVPGGRVALSVWKSPSPYNTAVGDALERFVGADIAARYRAGRLRGVPDAGALRDMMLDAGFRAVEVRPRTMIIRLPAIETFVLGHLDGHPVASGYHRPSRG